jgi:Pectinacetylesterase
MARVIRGVSAVLLCLFLGGCGSDEPNDPGDTPTPGIELLSPGWTKVEPGGRTMCARGTPWEFYVRPGTVNKVVVELEGGGACWDYLSCAPELKIFVDWLRIPPAMADESVATGILDHADLRNPFRDWHHVYVPYCTGDLAWGDSDHEYALNGDKYTVNHRGAVNVQAVLDWLKENLPRPEDVLVTGSSAGSYASIMWTPHFARQYPAANITQLGDSGAGAFGESAVPKAKAAWGMEASFPSFIDGADLSSVTKLSQLYALVAKGYPKAQLAEFNRTYDWNQTHFSGLSGGASDPIEWSAAMQSTVSEITDVTPGFRSYRASGWSHSVIEFAQLYTMSSGGEALTDWISALIGRTAESVECGAHCGGPWETSGDHGWECLSTTPEPASLQTDLELPLAFVHYHPPDYAPLPGLAIKACASNDAECLSPLDQTTANSVGHAVLHLPAGPDGFLGFLDIGGTDTAERLYFLPGARNSLYGPIADTQVYGMPSVSEMIGLAANVGVTYDPSQGFLTVYAFDCNLSWRTDVTTDLDGAPPTAFVGPASYVPSTKPASIAMWINVSPGAHTLHAFAPGSSTPMATLDVDVRAGTHTVIAGLGPATAQP